MDSNRYELVDFELRDMERVDILFRVER